VEIIRELIFSSTFDILMLTEYLIVHDCWHLQFASRRKSLGLGVARVSPIIRPSVIFEDDFNISPTFKISPS